jgi:mycothiol conjugate amidase Mca
MTDLRLMAVHAHQDDETISMGGTLAIYADRGVRTAVVCCTDGAIASIVHPDMPEETTRPRLTEIRHEELRTACAILGVHEVHFLDYGDSGMAGAESNNDPNSFWKVDLDSAIERLVAHIRRFKPHVMVTYDGFGGYGHPDHIQTHRLTLLAVEAARLKMYPDAGEPWTVQKLYYTAFPRSEARKAINMAKEAGLPSPFGEMTLDEMAFLAADEHVTTVIECRDGVLRKRDALRAHRSQIADDWPQLTIPEDIAREHFSTEHYQLVISRQPAQLPEDDLFAGIVSDTSSPDNEVPRISA